MKGVYVCGCLVGLATLAHGQGQVTGKVLDRQTRQPVPYASVVVAGTTTGTTCNAEGEFALAVARVPAKVLAFSLGYGRDSVLVAAAGAVPPLALAPVPIQLPTVEPVSYAAGVLAQAYQQLQRSQAHFVYGQAFYRQLTRNGNEPTEVLEAVWNSKSSSAGLAGTRLEQGRYAYRKAPMNFENFTTYTKVVGGFCAISAADTTDSHAVLSHDAARLYTLQFKGITQSNGRSVAEIAFVSRPGIPAVSGSLFIDLASYQVLHARATRPLTAQLSKPGVAAKDATVSMEVDFKPQAAGAVLNYIKATASLSLEQPHKPTVPVLAESFTSFYDQRPVPTGLPYAGPDAPASDLAAIKQKAYDPAFWRNNPAVKRTPVEEEVIRSFEQQKVFGTLFDK